MHDLALISLGIIAGIINSVAGGGAFIIYPLLLSLGVTPVSANATMTAGIIPGSAGAAYGYRNYIKELPRHYYLLLIPCFIGGLIGALLLHRTSNSDFEAIVPWFILFAAVLVAMQPRIHKLLASNRGLALENTFRIELFVINALGVLALSIYGGYFGAGFGIIMLAFLGFTAIPKIQETNGLKNLTAVAANSAAIVLFIFLGLIQWHYAIVIGIGTIIGGLIGARYSSRLPASTIRTAVVAAGVVLGLFLLLRA